MSKKRSVSGTKYYLDENVNFQSALFSAGVDFNAASLALGDIDHDGKIDIASGDPLKAGISLLTGNGDGTFTFKATIPLPYAPAYETLTDLNGDNNLDLITLNTAASGVVSVMLGAGNGTFGLRTDFSAGAYPTHLEVADLNMDGHPDIIVTLAEGNVSVLMGNGDGTFQAPVVFNAPRIATLAVADINGDGKPDIVTAGFDNGVLSVLLGYGDGTFHDSVNYAVASGAKSIAVGDLNGDGIKDIVTADPNSGILSELFGNGDGSFGQVRTIPAPVAPQSVQIADVDNDGKQDLIVIDPQAGNIRVLKGNGDGTFVAGKESFSAGSHTQQIAIADINGDGNLDVVTNQVFVLLGNGDATFRAARNIPAGHTPCAIAVEDLNGDQIPDIVTANDTGNNFSVLIGLGEGQFAAPVQYAAGSKARSVAIRDLNGDGIKDVVVANAGDNNVSVCMGNGDGTFQPAVNYSVGQQPMSVALADVNKDGKLDLLTGNAGDNNVSLLLGNGDGTFSPGSTMAVGASPACVQVADLNNDGNPDIVTANSLGGNISVLLGSGNGSFSAASNISIPGEPLSVAAGDLTGDGLVDLAVADYSGGNLTLLAGNGDGTFQPPVSAFTGDGASDVVIADINRDGTPDIVVTNELDGDVTAILEDGIGNYIIYRDYWLDGGTHSVAVQDLNADRKREIIAANRYGGDISILWNETPVTFRFDVFPNSVGFDTVALGSVKLDTITVANRSDTTQNIQVTLSDNPAFATIPGPQAFNPFEVRHYAVSFNPGALGNNAGHFVFTGNVTTPPETAGVHGVGSAIISLFSMYDSDGDPMTTADQAPKPWIMALYQDSVGPNTLVDSGLTAVLTTRVTAPGPYIAGEVQGGADWQRINGNRTLLDTLAILAPVVRDTFVNFQPNVLTVEFLEDNDGLLRTACDRSPDSWHADVRRDSAGGPVVAGGNGAVLDVPYLPDGNYVVTESDSSGWTPIGYAVGYSDSTPLATPGAGRTVMVSLGGGRSSSVQFINAPPVNNRLFRSFAPESLALDRDNRGKLGKFVLRKPDKDEFTFKLRPPFVSDSVISLALKFSMTVNAKISRVDVGGVQTVLDSVYGKVWSGVVHARPGYISVKGFGFKGTPVKVTYQWTMSRTGGAIRGTLPAASYSLNQPRLPMPDRVNALADCFSFGAFLPTGGLPVGYAAVDSPKAYGWLVAPKYSDVLKTLYDKGNLQDGPSSNFGDFVGGSPVVRQQKSLPPDKYNNVLLGDLIALKLNIAASAMGMTPVGFGELVFSDGSRGPLDGRMIRDIAALADSMISARSYYARFPSRDEYDASVGYGKLDTAIAAINHAFEGPIDTLTFADSLVFRGARPLGAVLFLRANPGVTPTIIHPLASPLPLTPVKYRLYQNYPNPFNPTTTIQFDLPEPAIVTLKIYNILGQEVLSIYDHQQLDEGREEVQFDAGGFSSGVYFYRLVAVGIEKDTGPASGFSSVKKMLLIK